MDDRRLDNLEQALVLHARNRGRPDPSADPSVDPSAGLPAGFTAGVMREVRTLGPRRVDFWGLFAFAARRFIPAGALAATAAGGYALVSEHVLNQALLTLSMHGGSAYLLAGLLP